MREAIAGGPLTRRDVYITTKISPYEHGAAPAAAACEALLQRLDLEYVDLVLIHWPGVARRDARSPDNAVARKETWRVLEEYYARGLFKAIGVSNYSVAHLEELMQYAAVPPAANQVECHPRWPQEELRQFCRGHGVAVIAYASFGGGALLRPGAAPEVAEVAARCGATPAEVLLRWGLQKGCAVIPKSVHPERIAEFAAAGRAPPLCAEDEALLDGMGQPPERREKFCWDPAHVFAGQACAAGAGGLPRY